MTKKPENLPNWTFASDDGFDKSVLEQLDAIPIEVADKYTHPSSFNKWCRRREVLRVLKQSLAIPVPRSSPDAKTQKVFEIGKAVHDHFRDTVLSSMMVGTWTCRSCLKQHGPMRKCPSACEQCGKKQHHCLWHTFRYEETAVNSETDLISGSIDGFIEYRGRLRVLEVKSEREDLWVTRETPSVGHVMQAQLYTGLARDLLNIDVSSMLVLYVNKTDGAIKAFLVPFSTDMYGWLMDEIRKVNQLAAEAAKQVKTRDDLLRVIATGQFEQDCPIVCPDRSSPQARSCPSRVECFSHKNKKG